MMIEQQTSQIQQQAAQYVARLYSGDMSAHDEQQLQAWCDANTSHLQEFNLQLAIWDSCTELYPTAVVVEKKSNIFKVAFAIAASLLVVVLSYSLTLSENHWFSETSAVAQASHALSHDYQTAVGEVSTVELADGTRVTLNTDTAMTVAFSASERRVVLQHGEAYFDVAKNPDKVFVINVGDKRIRVIGTKFNVRQSADTLKVSVTEGLVAVQDAKKVHSDDFVDQQDTLLPAGSVAAFSGASQVVSSAASEEINSALNWRKGVFRFENESLASVVSEFNRYRLQKIVLQDKQVEGLRISGVFYLKGGDSIINALKATLPIEVEQDNEQIFISMRKKI